MGKSKQGERERKGGRERVKLKVEDGRSTTQAGQAGPPPTNRIPAAPPCASLLALCCPRSPSNSHLDCIFTTSVGDSRRGSRVNRTSFARHRLLIGFPSPWEVHGSDSSVQSPARHFPLVRG